MEQRGMQILIWKEPFRNSVSRWSAASQAGLMLVHRYALSDNNKHTPVLVQGSVCEAPPSTEGSKTANAATAKLQWLLTGKLLPSFPAPG